MRAQRKRSTDTDFAQRLSAADQEVVQLKAAPYTLCSGHGWAHEVVCKERERTTWCSSRTLVSPSRCPPSSSPGTPPRPHPTIPGRNVRAATRPHRLLSPVLTSPGGPARAPRKRPVPTRTASDEDLRAFLEDHSFSALVAKHALVTEWAHAR